MFIISKKICNFAPKSQMPMEETSGSNKERFEKTLRRKDKLAGFLYDIAKAIFTMMVLANIGIWFTQGFSMGIVYIVILGLIATYALAWFANQLYKY